MVTGKIVAINEKKQTNKQNKQKKNKIGKHTHTIHFMEKRRNMVNFQIFSSVDVVLVNVGRRNLGGLSNDGKDLSRGQQLLIDWIDCFPIFVLVRRL